MRPSDSQLAQRLQTGFLGVIAFGLILALLVQARFILICLVFAIIVFSLTSDAISAFSRLRVPNWLATMLALIAIAVGLLWAATTVVAQVNEVVRTSIVYADRARGVLARLSATWSPGAQDSLAAFFGSIDIAGWIRASASQASSLVSGTVLMLTFVGFMFTERYWFPIKIDRLAGTPERAAAVGEVIHDIMARVNRYLVVKAVVSVITAGLIWIIFRAAGLDLANAVATLTFILNFIPTIGTIVATTIAIVLILAQTGDLWATLLIGGGCVAVQFVIGNIIDPLMLGQTLRLSTFFGIILPLAFWGAIWGISGTFLAVPVMVAVMITCSHISWLRPLAVMLSHDGLSDTRPTAAEAP